MREVTGIAKGLSQFQNIANAALIVNVLDAPDALIQALGFDVEVIVREDIKRGSFLIMSKENYVAFSFGRNNGGLI